MALTHETNPKIKNSTAMKAIEILVSRLLKDAADTTETCFLMLSGLMTIRGIAGVLSEDSDQPWV